MQIDFREPRRCCGCGHTRVCRHLFMLDKRAPSPGKGWGCAQCGLDSDGAVAIVCDECRPAIEAGTRKVQLVCAGYALDTGRVAVPDLSGDFRHDPLMHTNGTFHAPNTWLDLFQPRPARIGGAAHQ